MRITASESSTSKTRNPLPSRVGGGVTIVVGVSFLRVVTGSHGSSTVNRAPEPGWLSTVTVPPCSSVIFLTSDSPNPVPTYCFDKPA